MKVKPNTKYFSRKSEKIRLLGFHRPRWEGVSELDSFGLKLGKVTGTYEDDNRYLSCRNNEEFIDLLSNSLHAKAVTNGISQSELQAQERIAAEVLIFFVNSYRRQREYFRWFLPLFEGQLHKNVSLLAR
jgi:hypothetical protein